MKSSGLKSVHLKPHHSPQHGDHLVHFFDKVDSLEQALCHYVIPGICRGEGIVIVATAEHCLAFQNALSNRSIDVARVTSRGQMIFINAQELMSKFIKNQILDRAKFDHEIHQVLGVLKKKYSTIRAYGEMVNILCQEGNHAAAIELETMWENLIKTEPLSLFCGYHSGSFHDKNAPYFEKVCSGHSHIVVSDGVMKVR